MKKICLTDEQFNGYIGSISRRAVINEMITNRYVFETPLQKSFKKAASMLFYILLGICITLSAYTIGSWIGDEDGYKKAVKEIYQGNAKDVENNKKKAYYSIAGAGDDGIRKVFQGERK